MQNAHSSVPVLPLEPECNHAPRCHRETEDPAAAAASASLDPLELSLHAISRDVDPESFEDLLDARFRHSWWAHRRRPVFKALTNIGVDDARRQRFADCGKQAWVQQSRQDHRRFRVVSNRCRDRWCEACQRERRLRISLNLQERCPEGRIRFVTLTLKHNVAPLPEQIDRIIACFARLRRSAKMKQCFRGGMWFLEIKRSKNGFYWHPHLHCLVQGDYIPLERLRKAWHDITGDSFIVDIRQISGRAEAVGYVTKYAGKSCSPAMAFQGVHLEELMQALDDRNTFGTFGTWRGLKLTEKPSDDATWDYVCSLATLRLRIQEGDEKAMNILAVLQGTRAAAEAPDDPQPPPPEHVVREHQMMLFLRTNQRLGV